jgi:hydroxymethylpyrimidine pyrophosphatase-like HAD family hydrolase
MKNQPLTIAIDFDGTIVKHKYPKIGKELPLATHTIKALAQKGHKLILWTYRSGSELDEAVAFCHSRGIEFYAVNKNFPEEEESKNVSRKILADLYIDDRNLCGIPSWPDIYHMIHPEEDPSASAQKKKPRWKFW